jgi:hypothetical protein
MRTTTGDFCGAENEWRAVLKTIYALSIETVVVGFS